MIKSEVIKAKKEKPFPKLMKHDNDNVMVYFDAPRLGFVVSGATWVIGTMLNDWTMSQFEDTDDTVILTIGGG